jgi:hypothetical protein
VVFSFTNFFSKKTKKLKSPANTDFEGLKVCVRQGYIYDGIAESGQNTIRFD